MVKAVKLIALISLLFFITARAQGADPTVSLTINKVGFLKGYDQLNLAYDIKSVATNNRVDVYFVIQLPDNRLLFMDSSGNFTSERVKVASNWNVTDIAGTLFSVVVPESLADGKYVFWAVFAAPGSKIEDLQLISYSGVSATLFNKSTIESLYSDDCGGCHGPSRQGATGPALIPERLEGLLSDAAIRKVIKEGRSGTPMPSFKGLLTDEQIDALIGYLRSPAGEEATRWEIDDIRKSLEVMIPSDQWPTSPVHGRDVNNFMMVVERENRSLYVIDGSDHTPLERISASYRTHVVNFNPKEERWAYTIARDGWLYKIDLYSLKAVTKVRVGFDSRGLAVSNDGKYLIAGNYLPNTAVILKADTLQPLKIIETAGTDPDGKEVKSRVAATLNTIYAPYFIIALKEAGQVWIVDYSDPTFPIKATIPNVGRILHDAFVTHDGRYFMVASQTDDIMAIIDLEQLKLVKKIEAGDKPHPGPGAIFQSQGRWVAATPAIGEGRVTVWDTTTFEVIKTIKTAGPGLFIRAHPQSQYVWVDTLFGGEGDDYIEVFDKDTLEIVKTLKAGKNAVHPEFTRNGKYVYVSIWGEDKVLVYRNGEPFELVKEIPSIITPTGIFNTGNRREEPGA